MMIGDATIQYFGIHGSTNSVLAQSGAANRMGGGIGAVMSGARAGASPGVGLTPK